MRHVDEGTIHAWLDEQISDPAEAAWIDEHLRTCAACSARMAEERATFDRARGLLSAAEPAIDRPSFESLVARSAGARRDRSEDRPATRVVRGAVWMRAGWAASIVLAMGLGWAARDFTSGGPESVLDDPARIERAQNAQPAAVSDAVEQQSAVTPPAPPDPSASAVPTRGGGPSGPREGLQSSAPRRSAAGGGAVQGDLAAGARMPSAGVPAPPADAPLALTEVARALGAAANEAAASGAVSREQPAQGAIGGAAVPVSAAPPQTFATAPSPPASPAETSRTMIVAAPPAEAEAAAIQRRAEALAVGSVAPATPAAALEWRAVPRTEAAVRAGMPLYGVEGLAPVATSISADGRSVRTWYRLQAGEVVELIQSRVTADQPLPGGDARALGAAQRSTETSVRTLAPTARGAVLSDAAPTGARTWFTTRGDVRVVLRTAAPTADLDALGARLRVD
jgi:hypothetical protein